MAEAITWNITYGTDTPTLDAYLRSWEAGASIRWNTNAATLATGLVGWYCSVSGHPGTWIPIWGSAGGSAGLPRVAGVYTGATTLIGLATAGYSATQAHVAEVLSVGDFFKFDQTVVPVWSSATAYAIGDFVTLGAVTFVAVQAGTNHATTDRAFWLISMTRIASTDGLGSWVRLGMPNLVAQSQLTWSVDPTSGSDENTGITDGAALQTMKELARRTWGAVYSKGTNCVVRLLNSMLAADGAMFNVNGVGETKSYADPNISSANVGRFFTIVGVPSVVYSGTMSSPSQASIGGVGDNHFTDASAPAFTRASGRLWVRTNGTAAYFWPAKDLGSGTFRISQPTSNNAQATLANGDSWQIWQLPTAFDLSNTIGALGTGGTPRVFGISRCYWTGGDLNGMPSARRWSECQFPPAPSVIKVSTGTYYNCSDFGHSFTDSMTSALVISGGLQTFRYEPAPGNTTTNYGAIAGLYTTIQSDGSNTGIDVFQVDRNSVVFDARLMFYDCAGPCIALGVSPSFFRAGVHVNTIGGMNNTGKIMKMSGSAHQFSYVNQPPAGMTSDASPYQFNSFVSANPEFADLSRMVFSGIQ